MCLSSLDLSLALQMDFCVSGESAGRGLPEGPSVRPGQKETHHLALTNLPLKGPISIKCHQLHHVPSPKERAVLDEKII